MSNARHREGTEAVDRSSPMLFVVVLLMVVAAIVAFIAFQSSGPTAGTQPRTSTPPTQSEQR